MESSRNPTKKEIRDGATNFASFLYHLWQKSLKDEIIKVDKTNHDNEEPTNIN